MEIKQAQTVNAEQPADRSLSEWIYQQVKQKIVFFQYQPGQFLTETMLAAEYQVSKMPVKMAIRELEKEGWLEGDFRRKTRVKGITELDVRSLYDFRALLEYHALDLIFQKQRALEYADRLEERVKQVQDNLAYLEDYLYSERNVHEELVTIHENPRIDNVYHNLQDEVMRISSMSHLIPGTNGNPNYPDIPLRSWRYLIEQLRAREYELAKWHLHEHLERGLGSALDALQRWQQAQQDG